MVDKPRIGLVLGAGSARGLAHIGVLQVIKENNIPFDFIVGSSMGAIVGGLYACGTDIHMLGRMIKHMDMGVFFDVKVPRMGFVEGKRISEFLKLTTKNKHFSQTDVPFYAVATDLYSGKGIVMQDGLVWEAIRASISIPGVFKPVVRDGMLLVDGAVTDRLPVEAAREAGGDILIAVDVTFGEGRSVKINNTLDVIVTTLDIMQKQQFDVVSDAVDILIQPAVTGFDSMDFSVAAKLIELGRQAAMEHLDELKEKTKVKSIIIE